MQIIYQALACLKLHDKFYKDNSITKGLSCEDMFRFFDTVETRGQNKNLTQKKYS